MGSLVRFSGQSSCSMASLKEAIRAATDGSQENFPIELLSSRGAVDQTLISDGGRVKPRPPPGKVYSQGVPSMGLCTVILPTDGKFWYVLEEKLSQMLPAMALVASGLQAFVCRRVTGMRRSVERKLSVRKSSARTISCIFCLKSSVLVQAQY